MAITTSGTTLTFNDATTQTTAGLVSGGALGTPASGALTNCTSIPVNQATGTLPVANGGSGQTTYTNGQLLIGNSTGNTLTKAALTQGTGISITNGAGSITIASTATGTVTSVATGNGLSGGTITSTGTLVVACPSFNSVGSYAMGYVLCNDGAQPPSLASGDTYAAGGGNRQFQSAMMGQSGPCGTLFPLNNNNLSGTWRNMGAGGYNTVSGACFLICRVS
jgi:hypothetical protein